MDRKHVNTCVYPRPYVKSKVYRTIRIQPRNVAVICKIENIERSANHNSAILLNRHGINETICAGSRVKAWVQCSVSIQASDISPVGAADCSEFTRNDNLSVRLNRKGINCRVRAYTRIKS